MRISVKKRYNELQAMRREAGWKMMSLSIALMIMIPYLASLFLFQLCSLWL